jgi:hypothetical protein
MTHHLKDRFGGGYDEAYWDAVHRAEYREKTQCPECKRIGLKHWPYCSEAPVDEQVRYANAEMYRSLRTMGPL